ncbi:MAG: RluA family pseudouridine synthase [Candidatus Buchananbacteria bacterium]
MTNNNTTISFTSQDAEKDKSSTRLDRFLTEKLPNFSRTKIQKAIKDGLILVNNKITTVHQFLKKGDIINILNPELSSPQKPKADAEKIEKKSPVHKSRTSKDIFKKIEIIEDNEEFVIINKPTGLLVHSTEKNETNTLVDWLIKKYPKIKKVGEDPLRPAIIHRLDKDVSGLMLIPKTQDAFEFYKNQFKLREVTKKYTALVYGEIKRDEDEITFPIGRSKNALGLFVARPHGQETSDKEAHTKFNIIKKFKNYTLLEVQIFTGRTHQIRVHLLAYGYPIVGDPLYIKRHASKKAMNLDRIFLHASYLSFLTPKGERLEYNSPLPITLKSFLGQLNSD